MITRIRALPGAVGFLLWFVGGSSAQDLSWTPRDDLNANLPAGIRIYDGVNLSVPMRAWYVEADPADTTWQVGALRSDDSDGVETTASFAAGADAWVGVNGGYFGGGESYSLVVQDGVVLSPNLGALNRSGTTYYPTRAAFAVLSDGTPDVAWIYDIAGQQWAYPAPSPNAVGTAQPRPSAGFPDGGFPWPLGTGIGGGPALVENGQERITWEEEVFFDSGIGDVETRNPRTAVGYTADGRILLLVVDGRQGASAGASLRELASIMIDLGAVEAVNLDGGGSSTLVVNGVLLNRPEGGTFQRQVASALVLQPRKDANGHSDESTYFDTGDACCYLESGDWFESANSGFFGETPSRLNEVGAGGDRAVFRLYGIEAGTYEVSAWWVPASNRARNTPFTVYRGGVGSMVAVDQSDPLSSKRWNVLGSYDLAPGDSVVISDAAEGATSPSYVVVDAVRLSAASGTSLDDPELPTSRTLVLYPNPTDGRLAVRVPARRSGETWRGDVIDVLGRRLHAFRLEGPSHHHWIDLPHLANGVYFVRLVGSAGPLGGTFVVAR